MTVSLAQLESAEFRLVDLAWRMPPGRRRDDCSKALANLRLAKASLLGRLPSVLRKGSDMLDKRTHAQARDQRLHDALRDASAGHVCASYRAKAANNAPGTVDSAAVHMHVLHHSLADERGVKCDAVNLPPGGMPHAAGESEGQGTRFDEDKTTAARAAGLAKRLGRPVPVPAAPATFYWEVNGNQMGLDHLERSAEVDRINRYRRANGLVELQ